MPRTPPRESRSSKEKIDTFKLYHQVEAQKVRAKLLEQINRDKRKPRGRGQVRVGQVQRLRMGALPEKKETPEPGILSRTFDVLSRGQYASAEAARRVLSDKQFTPGDISGYVSGAVAGLTGKKKTSYSDVLEEAGVKNKVVRGVAGFAGDILLDPTTYVGVGLVKSVGVKAAGAAGVKLAKSSVKEAQAVGRAAKAAKLAEAAKTGKKITKETLKKTEEEARDDYLVQVASKGQREAGQAAERGRLELRLLGRPVGGRAAQHTGEAVYKALGTPGRKFAKTEPGKHLGVLFQTKKAFPGLADAKSIAENYHGVQFENNLGRLKQSLKGTKKSERELVLRHMTEGTLSNVQDPRIRQVADTVQEQIAEINAHRKGLGIEEPVDLLTQAGKHKDIADALAHEWHFVHREAARRSILDQAVQQFGVEIGPKSAIKKLADKGFVRKPMVAGIDNWHFDSEVADGLERMFKQFQREDSVNWLLKTFDRVQGGWKGAVTLPNPAFHMRNMLGDMWNNHLAGVTNPRYYTMALKHVTGQGKVKFKAGKHIVDDVELKALYDGNGLRSGFLQQETEIIPRAVESPRAALVAQIRRASAAREDLSRTAHFIHALKREARKTGDLNEAARKAAESVKKYLFDYRELTPFEKGAMKRAVPFYTWMRKNVPLQLEMFATKPGRVAVAPKGMRAVETILGTDDDDREPLPGLVNVVPQWLRDMHPIRTGYQTEDTGETVVAPRLPYSDVQEFFGDAARGDVRGVARTALNTISPLGRIPIEVATGRSLFTGGPTPGMQEYGLRQLPLSPIRSITKDQPLREKLLAQLGLSPYEVTSAMQRGELRRQQDPLQVRIRRQRQRLGVR